MCLFVCLSVLSFCLSACVCLSARLSVYISVSLVCLYATGRHFKEREEGSEGGGEEEKVSAEVDGKSQSDENERRGEREGGERE